MTGLSSIDPFAKTLLVPVNTSDEIGMWRQPTLMEIIPVAILALEVLLGLFCNLAAAWIYSLQPGTQQNVGDKFTVSLIIDDLILSGIAIPLVITLQLVNPNAKPQLMNYLCLCSRCALLFSAVSSASGNTLLALDRVDISLRPSKRFFRQKRPRRALVLVWLLSTLGLVFPLLSTWASNSFEEIPRYNQTIIIKDRVREEVKLSAAQQANYSALNQDSYDAYCKATCFNNHCELTELEITIRHSFQVGVFAAATLIIFVSYFQILHSIQQRNVGYAKRNVRTDTLYRPQAKQKQLSVHSVFCCARTGDEGVLLAMKTQKHITEKEEKEISNTTKASALPKICTSPTKPLNKRQSSFEHCSQRSGKTDSEANNRENQCCRKQRENITSLATGANNDVAKESNVKTDFASVALSVKAVMTMKKMIREKKKRKEKRTRHLKRMTFLITLTFAICWTPFNVLPLIRLFVNKEPQVSSFCEVHNCSSPASNGTFKLAISQRLTTQSTLDLTWNICFLWSLVLASASSIANPFLYSFSREKIRQDLQKVFCGKRQNTKTVKEKKRKFPILSKSVSKKRTAVWMFACEKKQEKNFKTNNVNGKASAVEQKMDYERIKLSSRKQNGKHHPILPDVKDKLLPETPSQNVTHLNDESTVETSCTSLASNRASFAE